MKKKETNENIEEKNISLFDFSEEDNDDKKIFSNNLVNADVTYIKIPIFQSTTRQKTINETKGKKFEVSTKENQKKSVTIHYPSGALNLTDKKIFRTLEYIVCQEGYPIQDRYKIQISEVCKKLGWKKSGHSYKLIRDSLLKIRATLIVSNGLIEYKENNEVISFYDTFNLISELSGVEKKVDGKITGSTAIIGLNKVHKKNLENNFSRLLDYSFQIQLNTFAFTLYELLRSDFYGIFKNNNKSQWNTKYTKYEYPKIVDFLSLKEYKVYSRIESQFKECQDELIKHQYISRCEIKETKNKFFILFYPGEKAIQEYLKKTVEIKQENNIDLNKTDTHKTLLEKDKVLRNNEDKIALYERLISYDVEEHKSLEIIAYNKLDFILEKINVWIWLKEIKKDKKYSTGFLIESIVKKYPIPEEYLEYKNKKKSEELKIKNKKQLELFENYDNDYFLEEKTFYQKEYDKLTQKEKEEIENIVESYPLYKNAKSNGLFLDSIKKAKIEEILKEKGIIFIDKDKWILEKKKKI